MLREELQLIPIHEAMALLDVSRSTIDRWRKNNELPSIKIGKEIYFDKQELIRWFRNYSRSTPSSAAAETVVIGYTTISTHMWGPLLIKAFGWFEEELRRIRPKDPVQVVWRQAKDGMALIKELVAGHVQIATIGDYAVSISQVMSRLLPDFNPVLLAAGGKSAMGQGFGLVVPINAQIDSLAELATLPIATTFRTNADYRLKKLLSSNQLPELNIVHRSIEDSLESLQKGRLYATMMWEPYLSLVKQQKIGKVLFGRELGFGFMAGVVADERWAQNHEDLTVAYLKSHLLANRWIREQPLKAAAKFAEATGLPVEAIRMSLSGIRWDAALYQCDLDVFKPFVSHTGLGHAVLAETEMEPVYNTRYLRIAAQALKLPVPPSTPIDGPWQQEIYY
jgi:NitT/TauT family transport system substrate-binding protein